jgi:hypothetical protein
MSPILYEGIISEAQDLVTPSQQQLLRETAHFAARNSMTLVRELLSVYQRFESASIPVVPYKGPVLAWLGYGSFARREYVDLDFVVEQRYIPEAAALLQTAGYLPLFDLREAHAGQHGFAPGQYSFLSGEQGIQVELHTERTLRYFPKPLDFERVYSRLMNVEISGRHLRTFSVEDSLVMLSVHGAKHFWERLLWILDIGQLITVNEVDWELLTVIAAQMESTRVLLLGLYIAHDLLGASLPPSVLEKASSDHQVRWLAAKVREQYAGISDPSVGVWPRAKFRFLSRDGIRQGVGHMLRLAMSPTESDREIVRLPHAFTPLYMLVRPWRLLREYGWGLRRRLKPGA